MRIPKEFENFDLEAFLNAPDVREFVGPGFDDFAKMWRADWAKRGNITKVLMSMHWNPLAVLASPVTWFAYRKMYAHAFGIIAVVCGMTLLFVALHMNDSNSAFLGGMIAIALMSKSFYFTHVYHTIKKIRALPPDQQSAALKKQGGVSVGAAWGVSILFLAALIISNGLGIALFSPELFAALGTL